MNTLPDNYHLPQIIKFGEQLDGSVIRPDGTIVNEEQRILTIDNYRGLPVSLRKDELINFLSTHKECIVQADTGSGKTTQVPKILHEIFPESYMVICQPRVVAAMTVADRVGYENIVTSGDYKDDISSQYNPSGLVGSRTGKGNSAPHTAQISFHTDALELMRQIGGRIPDVLVIDEIHGHTVPVEMLLLLYKYLHEKNPNIRLVMMSATIDTRKYEYFFGRKIPTLRIEGRSYPIEQFHEPEADVVQLAIDTASGTDAKDVLIFVDGKKKIYDLMQDIQSRVGALIPVYPLHAQLTAEEKTLALQSDVSGKARIVISTNVAQESITPENINCVIDTGEVKIMTWSKGVRELRGIDVSQFDHKQRIGRTGRTAPGKSIFVNKKSVKELDIEPIAPISISAIHKEILMLEKIAKIHGPGIDKQWRLSEHLKKNDHRGPFLHKIDKENIEYMYEELMTLGALDQKRNITPLGEMLLNIPLSPHNARILMESINRDCLYEMLPIVAMLESGEFVHKEGRWKDIKIENKDQGDLFALRYVLEFFLRNDHTDAELQKLIRLGIPQTEMEGYRELKVQMQEGVQELPPLGLFVDVSVLGVKTHQLRHIYNLIEDLKKRLPKIDERALDILSKPYEKKVYKKEDTEKYFFPQKVALATGFLHQIFDLQKKTKSKKSTSKQDTSSLTPKKHIFLRRNSSENGEANKFTQGNASIVKINPNKKDQCFLALPLRISPKGMETLSVALHITPIDESIVHEATHNSAFDERNIRDGYDPANETHTAHYLTKRTAYVGRYGRMKTKEEKVQGQLEVLVSFLLENNLLLRKYFEELSPERKEIFEKYILPLLLELNHLLRISPDDLEKTEASFMNDSILLYDLEFTTQPAIFSAFYTGIIQNMNDLGGFIPKKITLKKEEKEILEISAELQKEIVGARKLYLTEVYKIKKAVFESQHTFCGYPESDIKRVLRTKIIKKIFSQDIERELYDYMNYFTDIGEEKRGEVLQNIDEYRKKFRARRLIRNKVHSLEDFYSALSDNSQNVSLEYILAEFENIKDVFSPEERNRILTAIPRKNSPDKRKTERWKRHLDQIQQIIQFQKEQLLPQNIIDPKANEFLEFLTHIFAHAFEDGFFAAHIQERIFVLRNHLIKNANHPEIYKKLTLDFLGEFDSLFSQYTTEIRDNWEKLKDVEIPLDVYLAKYLEPGKTEQDHAMNIRTSTDIDYIQVRGKELQEKYKEWQKIKTDLDSAIDKFLKA